MGGEVKVLKGLKGKLCGALLWCCAIVEEYAVDPDYDGSDGTRKYMI